MSTKNVRVPSLNGKILSDQLIQHGVNGQAYQKIQSWISIAFDMGHNPLKTLRRLLPEWEWTISEKEMISEEDIYGGWCGKDASNHMMCVWVHAPNNNMIYVITARSR